MEISWVGHACFRLKGKTGVVITDPYDSVSTGLKLPKLSSDIVTVSHGHRDHANFLAVQGEPYIINGPGEYEIKGINVMGVATKHDNKNGEERGGNTVYNLTIDEVNVTHLGDLGHNLTSEQMEELGSVDILLIPVGGVYTIDGHAAAKVASELEPKIIIPMHYGVPGLKYQLETEEKFLKEMGVESLTPQLKLVVTKDRLPAETQVVILEQG